jgi:acyl-CoA synthetase (AMP-forming)/AMP-acid ligase II
MRLMDERRGERRSVVGDSCGSLVEVLRTMSQDRGDRLAFRFLRDGGDDDPTLSYGELDRRARATAAMLRGRTTPGGRALLMYPPGLDFIPGFFGCLYSGTVAVPAYPPDARHLEAGLPRIRSIVADARPDVILTTEDVAALRGRLSDVAPELAALDWIATDRLPPGLEDGWREAGTTADSLAHLQYTSGSTASPKGVVLTHGNLLHNTRSISQALGLHPESDSGVSWLPTFHDMGLVGGVLTPIYGGGESVLMAPMAFLRRPLRWLRAIARHEATISPAPNFAYELCVRRTRPEQREGLDLSRWRVALTGAEPVRAETLEAFAEAFAPCGFRREAFYPCYGLAEGTLIVTGGVPRKAPVVRDFDRERLDEGQAATLDVTVPRRRLVGSGRVLDGQRLAIVDPRSHEPLEAGRVGEIWVSGPSIAAGYWGQPDQTRRTFDARLGNGGGDPFLRTGDLGFLWEGELMVCGRLKDLIILNGRNIAPEDIEQTVDRSFPEVIGHAGGAFSVEEEGQERVVIVYELDRRHRDDAERVAEQIRATVASEHGISTGVVVLIEPHTIPKTASGKIQRHACRDQFLRGELQAIHTSRRRAARDPDAAGRRLRAA